MTRKRAVTGRRYTEQGKRLRDAREAAGLSRPDVAAHVVPGATRGRQTVYEWEAGIATPSVAQLAELCRLYRVSADVLLGLPTHVDTVRLRVIGRIVGGQIDPEVLAELAKAAEDDVEPAELVDDPEGGGGLPGAQRPVA